MFNLKYDGGVAGEKASACRAWELLTRLWLVQRGHLPAVAAEFELSPVQCHVLYLLEPDRPVPMRHLAEALACDASNVTGLVDRLEARGLIERQPAPFDRRVKVLALTSTGMRVRAQLQRRLSAAPDRFNRLSAAERQMLARLLERLLD
jgi:DNA-binding MarR family transcriptional regulator